MKSWPGFVVAAILAGVTGGCEGEGKTMPPNRIAPVTADQTPSKYALPSQIAGIDIPGAELPPARRPSPRRKPGAKNLAALGPELDDPRLAAPRRNPSVPGPGLQARALGGERPGTRPGAEAPQVTVPLAAIPIIRTVVRQSPNYQIAKTVRVDGYYYHFQVHTPHNDYEVASVRGLVKLLHEIDVLEHFRKTDHENHIWTGISSSAKGIGRGAKNLVLHPGQSIKKVGVGAGRFLRGTGRFFGAPFRRRKNKRARGGGDRSLLGHGPAGGERRRLAYQLGLDVYTDNETIKALLNEVARRRLAGSLPLSATVFALPGGAVFTLSLTPVGFDPSTEELIRDNGPEELKLVLARRYRERFGLQYGKPGMLLTELLDNPNYTPREQAYLLLYLTDMRQVRATEEALKFLAKQNSPERARIVGAQVELLSLLHQRGKPLARFVPVRNTLGARSRDGTLCFVISIDTVRFWSDVTKSLELAITAAKRSGARRIEIWSTGDVDRKSERLANRLGVTVHQNILENPLFRRPRKADPTLGSRP